MSPGNQAGQVSGHRLLAVTAVTLAFYLAILLVTAPRLSALAGGLAIFDLMPMGYGADHARLLLERLGDAGRSYYLTRQLPLDALYPGLLALTLTLAWIYLGRRAALSEVWLRHAWTVPALAACGDYAENVAVAVMLLRYPAFDPTVAALASGLTVAKSGLSALCFSALLALGGWLAFRRVRAAVLTRSA